MSWEIGYDTNHHRDVGYGVPAICDHPDCTAEIDRGLSYVCGGEAYGGEYGCGLFFCDKHLYYSKKKAVLCDRCSEGKEAFDPKPDTAEWIRHKLTDPSWAAWREEHHVCETFFIEREALPGIWTRYAGPFDRIEGLGGAKNYRDNLCGLKYRITRYLPEGL